MIPFEELIQALDRYKRRQAQAAQAGRPPTSAGDARRSANPMAGDPSAEIPLDEVEEA